jgi:2-polyprenyl-3-methyl-5-hydroxy-6-metoxy-1,4-benzoquinol methylase
MNIYLKKFIQKIKPKTAFDFGCGDGFDVAGARNMDVDAAGLDLPECDMNYPQKVGQYDLVYSNYVFPFVKNKKMFVSNLYNNLKIGGSVFVATFSLEDETFKQQGISKEDLSKLFSVFNDVEIEEKKYYDNEEDHQHWHKLLILKGQK